MIGLVCMLAAAALARGPTSVVEAEREVRVAAARASAHPGRAGPRRRLAAATDAAVALRVQRARTLEEQDRFTEAIAELEAAARLLARAERLGAQTDSNGTRERHAALEAAASDRQVQLARAALAAAQLAEASARLDAASAFAPGDQTIRDLHAEVLVAWADRDLEQGRPAAAVAHLDRAHSLGGAPAVEARAQALHVELGRRALSAGACRAAHAHLAAAGTTPEDTERAAACARTAIDLRVGADRGELRAVVNRTQQSAEAYLATHGSAHLALDAGPRAEPRALPGPDGPVSAGPYEIRVEVWPPTPTSAAASRELRRVRATRELGCPAFDCTATTVVTLEELAEPWTTRITAAVTRTDRASGRASTTTAIGVGHATARWTGSVLGMETQGVYTREVTQVVWGRGGDPAAHRSAQAARETARADARDAAASALGEAIARGLLLEIDTEPAQADRPLSNPAPGGAP